MKTPSTFNLLDQRKAKSNLVPRTKWDGKRRGNDPRPKDGRRGRSDRHVIAVAVAAAGAINRFIAEKELV